ncbi:DUF1007 family protein [Litoreibacter ponti]|nr:DUF1007 family protein [Litoreibacter ponti]
MRYLLAALMLAPAPALAHPHVFVDTGVEVIFDEAGRVTHLRITWEYDELYSLWITEDMKLDPDFDGELTDAEMAALQGFDQDWMQGYYGDTRAYLGGTELALSRPVAYTADYKDGRLSSTHLREVEGSPFVNDALVIKPYDETFYTAYDVTKPVRLTGAPAGCGFDVVVPDVTGALTQIQEQLLALDPSVDPADVGFDNIGAQFATQIEVTCAGS